MKVDVLPNAAPKKGVLKFPSWFFVSLHFSVSCGLYWAMEQESLTRSVRSPPTSTLPTTTRRLHVLGGEGEAKNRMDLWGVGSMGFVMVLFCFACFSALLLLGLFSIIYLDRHYGSFYSSANKVDGWTISSPKKPRPMGCTEAPVISGGSSEGKHGHPVSC